MGKSNIASSTAPDILQKMVRFRETLEPSTPILSLLRTDGAVRAQDKITRKQENNAIVNNAADEILLTQKLSATNHEAP